MVTRSHEITPSLFPIFNVLVCLLGTLILIMATVASMSLGPARTLRIRMKGVSDPAHRRVPIYIEWDGASLTIHPERDVVPFDVSSAMPSDAEIRQIVRESVRRGGDVVAMFWERFDRKVRVQLSGTSFARVLETARARSTDTYVVLLIRPSGFASFLRLRNFVLRQGMAVGYEPIEQSFKVRVD